MVAEPLTVNVFMQRLQVFLKFLSQFLRYEPNCNPRILTLCPNWRNAKIQIFI